MCDINYPRVGLSLSKMLRIILDNCSLSVLESTHMFRKLEFIYTVTILLCTDVYTHRLGSWSSCFQRQKNKDVIQSLHLEGSSLIMRGPQLLQLENWEWRHTSLYSISHLRYCNVNLVTRSIEHVRG